MLIFLDILQSFVKKFIRHIQGPTLNNILKFFENYDRYGKIKVVGSEANIRRYL